MDNRKVGSTVYYPDNECTLSVRTDLVFDMSACAGDPKKGCFGGIKIHGRGPSDSPIVIIGESPGVMELARRRVFVGPSGKILDEGLAEAYKKLGVSGDQIIEPLYLNAIECFPRKKTPESLIAAIMHCRDRLIAKIKEHPRTVIITLGAGALWSVTGDSSYKVTKARGAVVRSELALHGILPAVHPAFLLRGNGNYPQFLGDVAYGISLGYDSATAISKSSSVALQIPYTLVDSPTKALDLRKKLDSLPPGTIVAADIETASFSYMENNKVFIHPEYTANPILCLGLYWDAEEGAYIVHPDYLSNDLFPEHVRLAWHNGKFDIKFFHYQDFNMARVDEDTMLMSYALNERRGIHDLDQCATDHLGTAPHKSMLESFLPKKRMSYANIPAKNLYSYLALDVFKTWKLAHILGNKVKGDVASNKLYSKLLIPASKYLAEIEMNGMPLDREWTENNLRQMTLEANEYEGQINAVSMEITGAPINPRSPLQLQELLYTKLGLARPGTSTNADTLEKLPQHAVVVALRKYRKVHKGLSTYVQSALDKVAPDGKVHTSYLIHGTVTGRLASRDPNMQNIPRDPKLRGQYRALPGHVFIEPDLNQAELRSLACMSGDPELCRIYNTEGMSLHDEVRNHIFSTPNDWSPEKLHAYFEQFGISQDTPEKMLARLRDEQKMIAKNTNFGIVYGITPFGLADQIERPVGEAEQYIRAWFTRFPKAKEFINKCSMSVSMGKTITTVYGRKKRPGVVSYEKLRDLQNEAANFPHQATASDFTLDTGIRCQELLRQKFKTTIHNTVHDSILLMAPYDLVLIKEVCEYITSELSATPKRMGMTRVPFKADAKIGDRWGHLIDQNKWFKQQEQRAA